MVKSGRLVQIVLAAGRSERMGSPKPLLDFDGHTALELVLTAARSSGVKESVVVVGSNASQVIDAHAEKGIDPLPTWVRNPEEGSEQLRSLQLGLLACRPGPAGDAGGFFVHPVDHPLSSASDYSLLVGALTRDESSAGAFILSHEGRRGHPILCRWHVASRILALGSTATARDAIEGEKIVYVITENAGAREDMDTPADYRRLADLHRTRSHKRS